MQLIKAQYLDPVLDRLIGKRFTTQEFIAELVRQDAALYEQITTEYGAGGKGSGRHYSASVHVGKSLSAYEGKHQLSFLDYIQAPPEWGNRVIALWECRANDGADTVRVSNSMEADISDILANTALSATERSQLVLTRIGQGDFRKALIRYWKRCPVTGCPEVRLLTASHIKPWSASSPAERLDPFNGLLLTPNVDRVFDRGLVTFQDDGSLLCSSLLTDETVKALGIKQGTRILLEARHLSYMAYHREHVFESK